ncbi:MAG: hypothetical protein NT018_02675 [Armatimonadetes bacterium]|nr:hypothetical protein [Armatimonadota bacterium]
MNDKPIAVIRRDIMASTGPSIYGIKRSDKVKSPKSELFTFLGVCDGIAHVEREDKTKGEPFMEIETEDFEDWQKVR